VGLESPSHGHSELLNSSILNSFQRLNRCVSLANSVWESSS
jgi:hypothetical protein